MRDCFNVSQYLNNAMSMIRNWSKDRVRNKPFYEEPIVDAQTWSLAWNYLYKGIQSLNKGCSWGKRGQPEEKILFQGILIFF